MALWILPVCDDGTPDTPFGAYAVLADSVTETVFGPLIRSSESTGLSAVDMAQAFLDWLAESKDIHDARSLPTEEVCEAYRAWLGMVEQEDFR